MNYTFEDMYHASKNAHECCFNEVMDIIDKEMKKVSGKIITGGADKHFAEYDCLKRLKDTITLQLGEK